LILEDGSQLDGSGNIIFNSTFLNGWDYWYHTTREDGDYDKQEYAYIDTNM
jgi:hypothetical protein